MECSKLEDRRWKIANSARLPLVFLRLLHRSTYSGCMVSPGNSQKNRGRVDILRQTAGRGGKTVTVVTHFVGIGLPEKEMLAKKMQKVCGTGGTVKEGRIEIQGDKREEAARILTEAGFRPVFAGG